MSSNNFKRKLPGHLVSPALVCERVVMAVTCLESPVEAKCWLSTFMYPYSYSYKKANIPSEEAVFSPLVLPSTTPGLSTTAAVGYECRQLTQCCKHPCLSNQWIVSITTHFSSAQNLSIWKNSSRQNWRLHSNNITIHEDRQTSEVCYETTSKEITCALG